MKLLNRCLTASVMAALVVSASAQEPSKKESEETVQTTLEMRDSAWKEFQKADEQLNKVFKYLLSQLDSKSQKKKLRDAQQAWLRYRDKTTDFASSFYEGGSMQPQYRIGWMTVMTVNRTKELQIIIDESLDK